MPKSQNSNWVSKEMKNLLQIITQLKSVGESTKFFRDLCTMSELKAMAERWAVVRLIEKGISYRKINKMTGASTATVTRIAHWLRYGEGGYEMMLKRMKKN